MEYLHLFAAVISIVLSIIGITLMESTKKNMVLLNEKFGFILIVISVFLIIFSSILGTYKQNNISSNLDDYLINYYSLDDINELDIIGLEDGYFRIELNNKIEIVKVDFYSDSKEVSDFKVLDSIEYKIGTGVK